MNILAITFSIYPERSGQAIYTAALFRKLNFYTDMYIFSYGEVDCIDIENKCLSQFREIHFYKYIESRNLCHLLNKMCVLNCTHKQMLDDIKNCYRNNKIEYILLDHIGMTGYYSVLKKTFPSAKFIYSSHNIERLNIEASLRGGSRNKKFWRWRSSLHKHQEKKILDKVNMIFSISSKDTEYFVREMGISTPIYSIKPSYDFKELWNRDNIKTFGKKLLIVGSMNWYPNVSGTIKFVKESFSKLIEKDSEYRLYIVGKNPVLEIFELGYQYPQIIIAGFVDDIDLYYQMCDIAIVPVYEGTGLKIKLIEAAGKGIPIITTRFSVKEYIIEDEVFLADDPTEFLGAIAEYEADENLRRKMHLGALSFYNKIIRDSTPWEDIFGNRKKENP